MRVTRISRRWPTYAPAVACLKVPLFIFIALILATPRASADDLRGKTVVVDITVPICAFVDGTQECLSEFAGLFYLAAIFIADNGDLFYSVSFLSNSETNGVRIPGGSGSGERISKTKSGETTIDFVEVERVSQSRISVMHTSEWVEDETIRQNTLVIDAEGDGCEIKHFRQETFTNSELKIAYGEPTDLKCEVREGPQTGVYGD